MPTAGPHASSVRSLGILTTTTRHDPPFENRSFYRRLCSLGRKLKLQVFVFTPESVDWEQSEVSGFEYDTRSQCWIGRSFALPALVYDRCFFTTRRQYTEYRQTMEKLRKRPDIRLLGCGLKGKWDVHRLLTADGRFDRYLPPTERLRSTRRLIQWLEQYGEALLKPSGGSQGRGVLHLRQESRDPQTRYTVRGRDAHNTSIARGFADTTELLGWLRLLIGGRSYLVQRYLRLHSRSGGAFDVRALVQKNGAGRWQLTGLGVRLGQDGSLTSNLHGGGRVEAAAPWLSREFGEKRAEAILAELTQLCIWVPEALEAGHGRLAEVGLDFGIDTDSRIWLLEANSKPGRSIFTYLRDEQALSASLASPLRYADYLLDLASYEEAAAGTVVQAQRRAACRRRPVQVQHEPTALPPSRVSGSLYRKSMPKRHRPLGGPS
ncbi:YheC/YheD family endospore coat-associated protein [Paenibacillus puerhi]|uniref:YheC/YheD family endospore coat-associated protein n=1 Tax=Paenibacillus puerhi TaxID=2692622 RepID=UPI00135B511D|nr:YheC/YheD family protein [Paenibacillus puerhi]